MTDDQATLIQRIAEAPPEVVAGLLAMIERPRAPVFEPGRLFVAKLAHEVFGRRTHWTMAEELHIGKVVLVRFVGVNAYGAPFVELVHWRLCSGCIPLSYLSDLEAVSVAEVAQ